MKLHLVARASLLAVVSAPASDFSGDVPTHSPMCGTAETEAAELWDIYKLDVVTIPTNVTVIRKDSQDLVYKTKREKYRAVIDDIERLRSEGRPSLVGTTSVEVSELLSKMLSVKKIPHNVLNAKQHAREAQVVAEAGLTGAVTIAKYGWSYRYRTLIRTQVDWRLLVLKDMRAGVLTASYADVREGREIPVPRSFILPWKMTLCACSAVNELLR
jgi:hypothetical protein